MSYEAAYIGDRTGEVGGRARRGKHPDKKYVESGC